MTSKNSRKVNIQVLNASVNEHERQLNYHLQRPLSTFFRKLYAESKTHADETKQAGDQEDLILFQKQLQLIPKWNQKTIEQITDLVLGWLRNKSFSLIQSIKTVVVGRTMLMVAMGNANSEVDDRVRVDIPDKYNFIHNVISLIAYELYSYPSLMRINKRDTESESRDKQRSVNDIIKTAIEDTIVDQLSSPAVFAYLNETMNVDHFDGGAEDEEDDEVEVGEPLIEEKKIVSEDASVLDALGFEAEVKADSVDGSDDEEEEEADNASEGASLGGFADSEDEEEETVDTASRKKASVSIPSIAAVVDNTTNTRIVKDSTFSE
jgi:hypothetical protein